VNPKKFFAELKRRNVYKVGAAYVVVAWLLIQVTTQTFPFFEIPNWAVRLVILLLALGLPVALIIAWAFELTPEGIKRTEDVPREQSIARRTGRKLDFAIIGVLVLAVALLLFDRFRGKPEAQAQVATAKSVAVLPFQNLSKEEENAFFANGVHEEILTTLSKVADLKVISRTSVMQFRDPEKRNLREIAQALNVAHVLEGSVQRSANRVRVTAQLIDARTDTHLWAERYDRDLADVFAIQTEIAQNIAAQLKAALSPKEQAALQSKPTTDTVAYDLYLRAREIARNAVPGRQSSRDAIAEQVRLLDEAVARDPTFVSALCMLAQVHLRAYWFNFDNTPARLDLARKPLEAAARVKPDAGEVHLTRAVFHYWAHRDYDPALAELALARRSLPNAPEVPYFAAAIERRQGRWEQSIKSFEEAIQLDPRDPSLLVELSLTHSALRRYDEVRRLRDIIITWQPQNFEYRILRAETDREETGDLTLLQTVASSAAARTADPNVVADLRLSVALFARDYPAAEKALAEYRLPDFVARGVITPREYYEGLVARGLGDEERAAAAFRRARERAAAAVSARPDDARALIALASIDAALGRKEDAVREGERAVELLSVARDTYEGPRLLGRLAGLYAEVREPERGLDVLEKAVTLPGGPTYGDLKLSAAFDPLRDDPRFQKILASLAPKERR
jgi:TolB-like protein